MERQPRQGLDKGLAKGMPRFVANGPDLPVELLEAQTADKLVIFAGAGVSRPELPDFGGLVERLYEELGEVMEGPEERLFERGDYDHVLNSLEKRVHGFREKVRDLLTVDEGFEPKTHRALLDIARAEGSLRLVTTNFDQLFLKADPDLEGDLTRLSIGPRLPTPRPTHWEGLVHLHGLIHPHDPEGKNLVLTSSDFGRAYLVDQWASRFVTELFRHFHVLFVGYGVNDPVLRYLFSALAAERTKDGGFLEAFALAGVQGRQRKRKAREEDWEAKGVTPIFYHSGWEHRALNKTLKAWAKLSRGGLQARQSLALQNVDNPPSNPGDDQARLTIWALSEKSGSVAKSFSKRKPPPPSKWLQIFEDCSELPDDQKLLALAEKAKPPPSPLVPGPSQAAFPLPLSDVTRHLVLWLVKHLNTSEAVEWVLSHGAVLHPTFRWLVRSELAREDLELTAQRRKFWEVVASETYAHLKTQQANASRYGYSRRDQPASNWLQWSEVVTVLRPVPRLASRKTARAEAARFGGKTSNLPSPNGQEDYFHVDLELTGGSTAQVILRHLIDDSKPLNHRFGGFATKGLIDDAPRLLHEVLLWQSHFDDWPPESQRTYDQMPSISPHPQNRHRSKWTLLIALNRVAFEWLNASDPARVQSLIDTWLSFDFLVFRRLALHAMTEGKCVDPDLGIEVLLANDAFLLWDREGQREGLRFLRKTVHRTSAEARAKLAKTILEGPPIPPEMTVGELEPEDKERWKQKRWLRLSRLKIAGVDLPNDALGILAFGEERGWSIPSDHGDELAFQHVEAQRLVIGDEPDLREWVRENPSLIADRLERKARSNEWDIVEWRTALQNFGTPSYEDPSDCERLDIFLHLLTKMPGAELEALLHQISYWFQEQARKIPQACEQRFLTVIGRVTGIALQQAYVDEGNVIDRALNHPAGHLAQAVLRRIWSRRPEADTGIPAPLEPLLRNLAEAQTKASRLSRAIFVMDLGSLFLLDRAWTEEVLVPHFHWDTAPDADSMWQAFLSHPRWEPNLIALLKENFLAAFDRIEDLEPHRENACRFLVFTSIHYPEALSKKELQAVLRGMTPDDLAFVAGSLETVLSDSDQPATVWRETVQPWIEDHWPVRQNAQSPKVSHALALVVLGTGDAFPQAVDSMKSRMRSFEGLNYQRMDWQMERKGLARQFPEESLDLLDKLVPAQPTHSWSDLAETLDVIEEEQPGLSSDNRMRRLREVIMRNPY